MAVIRASAVLLLALCPLVSPLAAEASESYAGVLKAEPRGGGAARGFQIGIVFDVQDDKLTGQLTNRGASKCHDPVAIKGRVIGDALSFNSEPHRPGECGQINFRGMREGDALVGEVPWHGKMVEMTFSPQK